MDDFTEIKVNIFFSVVTRNDDIETLIEQINKDLAKMNYRCEVTAVFSQPICRFSRAKE